MSRAESIDLAGFLGLIEASSADADRKRAFVRILEHAEGLRQLRLKFETLPQMVRAYVLHADYYLFAIEAKSDGACEGYVQRTVWNWPPELDRSFLARFEGVYPGKGDLCPLHQWLSSDPANVEALLAWFQHVIDEV